jgi:hypothetical protein
MAAEGEAEASETASSEFAGGIAATAVLGSGGTG